MPDLTGLLRRGIRLPPSGWMLAAMLAFYVLAGLFGRDPWKGEDAIHIGVTWSMLQHGDWLVPMLAGQPFNEPPLYYWSAALTGKALGWLLPLHEAIRLASGLWVALALMGLYYAGRELHGEEGAAASPLLLAGSAGLLLHAHDAQPMLVALAAYAGSLGALASAPRKPRLAGIFLALSLSACLLGAGIAPTLILLIICPLACLTSPDRRACTQAVVIGLILMAGLSLPWPALLWSLQPARFQSWLAVELAPFKTPFSLPGLGKFIAMTPWFAFPALPLAGWTLYSGYKDWHQRVFSPAVTLPGIFVLVLLPMLAWTYLPREIPSLLLLPAIALLATPGALGLRRGAANAFDWFAMSTLTLFMLVVWLGWSAMVLGWPSKLAARALILRPGFIGELHLLATLIALAAMAWWIWLIVTAPRSPYRSLTHWTMGVTVLWLLANTLVLPWFDYGKSYRPVAQAIAAALPAEQRDCVAERNLTDPQRASLAYFVGIEPQAELSAGGKRCDWLLVVGDTRRELAAPGGSWQKVWEGSRPGDRKEKFRLFRR